MKSEKVDIMRVSKVTGVPIHRVRRIVDATLDKIVRTLSEMEYYRVEVPGLGSFVPHPIYICNAYLDAARVARSGQLTRKTDKARIERLDAIRRMYDLMATSRVTRRRAVTYSLDELSTHGHIPREDFERYLRGLKVRR